MGLREGITAGREFSVFCLRFLFLKEYSVFVKIIIVVVVNVINIII